MVFKLRVSEAVTTAAPSRRLNPLHRPAACQIRIEPGRRSYSAGRRRSSVNLFGTPERWGQTLRPMLWTHLSVVVPPLDGSTEVDLPVPCSSDFNVAATRYFTALNGGDLPLCFLFSGTIFYEADDGALQIAQISWEKECDFRLPASAWRAMMWTTITRTPPGCASARTCSTGSTRSEAGTA